MSFLYTPRPFTAQDKRDAVAEILDKTVPDRDFYVLVIGAVLLAIAGIFLDSIAVLIASMIVAPLAYPILGLSFSLVSRNGKLFLRCFLMLVISLVIAIVSAIVLTLCFGNVRVDPIFISFESNLYIATAIALIAGAVATYGLMRAKVGGAMTGIGIAVSLMPPLVATGIGLADPNTFPVTMTFLIFLLNVGGILLGSIVVFLLMGFHLSKNL